MSNQEEDKLKKEKERLNEEIGKLKADQAALNESIQKERESKLEKLEKEIEGKRKVEEEKITKGMSVKTLNELNSLKDEIAGKREKMLQELDSEMTEKRLARFASIDNEIEKERTQRQAAVKKEMEQARAEIEEERTKLDAAKKKFKEVRLKVQSQQEDLEYREDVLKAHKETMSARKAAFDEKVNELLVERQASLDQKEAGLQEEVRRLRDSLSRYDELENLFEDYKVRLKGKDPAEVLADLTFKEEELIKLRKDLAKRPPQEIRKKWVLLEKENQALEQKLEQSEESLSELRTNASEVNAHKHRVSELEVEKKLLQSEKSAFETECNRLESELKRISSAYIEERDNRIGNIELPYFENPPEVSAEEKVDEREWLKNIEEECMNYGLKFPRRILHSFHTALKTSEISPLTILSGVSGTGKSQLPKLYAHFGGINFLNLAVQPNWDSKEAMLGFFNSIDNYFKAEPVTRLLAQTQKVRTDDYPGLKQAMTIILLDEMNLAYAELYFAEFLSKLEERRGESGKKLPIPEIELDLGKLGPNEESYKIRLGRNVLWTGTMNQDETTKSLSDKVLDRGIIINFPRPEKLERRLKFPQKKPIEELLNRKAWESWWAKKVTFEEDEIKPYKEFVEEMNSALKGTGRAIGHRVWQSLEFYLENYPDLKAAREEENPSKEKIKKAMDIAFEDQLVQKIMPKLRGIETRGGSESSKSLEAIRAQLVDRHGALVEDFDLACKSGHGAFLWNSAIYLKETGGDDD